MKEIILRIFRKKMQTGCYLNNLSYTNDINLINNLSDSNNLKQRSLNQHACQTYGQKKNYIIDIFALILIVPYFILTIFKSLFKMRSKDEPIISLNASFLGGNLPGKYKNAYRAKATSIGSIKISDALFIYRILATSFLQHPYYTLKNLVILSYYAEAIYKHKPLEIISSNEYSSSSSLITSFLRYKKIHHTNIMHGERFIEKNCAYATYDKLITWDSYYLDIFKELKVYFNDYEIIPLKLEANTNENIKFLTYYTQTFRCLNEAIQLFDYLTAKSLKYNKVIHVRFHPIYTSKEILEQFKQYDKLTRESNSISIEDSIASSEYVCSTYSTIFHIAKHFNKGIIIDDRNKLIIEKLKEMKYIFINKEETINLSDL